MAQNQPGDEHKGEDEHKGKAREIRPRDPEEVGATTPVELPDTQPPMELKQDASGMWMYHRGAWAGGDEVIWNGAGINVTDRKTAEHIVNILYPGSFPESVEEAEDLPLGHQARENAAHDERDPHLADRQRLERETEEQHRGPEQNREREAHDAKARADKEKAERDRHKK